MSAKCEIIKRIDDSLEVVVTGTLFDLYSVLKTLVTRQCSEYVVNFPSVMVSRRSAKELFELYNYHIVISSGSLNVTVTSVCFSNYIEICVSSKIGTDTGTLTVRYDSLEDAKKDRNMLSACQEVAGTAECISYSRATRKNPNKREVDARLAFDIIL